GRTSNLPPRPNVLPEWPVGRAIIFEPSPKESMRITRAGWQWRANKSRRLVECNAPFLSEIRIVVVETPRCITAIPSDVQVFRPLRKYECVSGQMRFDKAAVRLMFKASNGVWRRQAKIDPR